MKPGAGSLEELTKLINPQPDIRGEIITNTTETQTIIGEYHEQFCANKLCNLEEMDKFPETYNQQN